MTNQLKNPFFWYIVLFAAGAALAAWGWDKNESTITARTVGAIPMIIVGCVSVVCGAIGMATSWGKKK